MSLKNDDASVLADAQWIPTHLSPDRKQIQFAWVPRPRHSEISFLADQYLRDLAPPTASLEADRVAAGAPRPESPPHFIFHSAFCCSTLIARALDLPGVAMGLKEPQILNELAAAMRARALGGDLLRDVSSLLARPFGSDESIVIKPSNDANVLAESLLRLNGGTKAVLLYAPLPKFLRSIVRKGMWGRIWSRRLYARLRRDPGPEFGFSEAELFEQTDLQIAATAWLMHHHHFAGLLAAFPVQVRMLDSETFLAHRAECLAAIGDHFGLRLDLAGWKGVADGDVFREHSKEIGRAFAEDEEQRSELLPPFLNEEIAMVCRWAESLASHIGLSLEPPESLRIRA